MSNRPKKQSYVISNQSEYNKPEVMLVLEAIQRAAPDANYKSVVRLGRQLSNLTPEFITFTPRGGTVTTICNLRGRNGVVASGVAIKSPEEEKDDQARAQTIAYGRAVQAFTIKRI